ncbi:class I SAM-dependent methyltransferase [Streptomyces sp. NPDC088789]|uniref:class I SAM-dependent methyltransferase n=1 Tax=Streptomyces sp. NPDC088789 TaxID=3365899 RepID=UPI00380BFB48
MNHRSAPDIAAAAALLQIGAELRIDHILESGDTFSAADLAELTQVPEHRIAEYVGALVAAGLVGETETTGQFRASDDYADWKHEAGYVSWALSANSPFIEKARDFLIDRDSAAEISKRDGRRVAVSSRWIGEQTFYPAVINRVVAAGATRVADLGAGAAGLLIRLLQQDSARMGLALDISAAACTAAREAAVRSGVSDRLEVVERPIESLVEDSSQIDGANAILACFVLHDIIQDDDLSDSVLHSCYSALAPGGFMAVVDAVSYAQGERERKFSALFTYLHANFMKVHLPSEKAWLDKFNSAGFSQVESTSEVTPGGRLFVATK